MDKLKIAWLFPDTLYLHGERGNILALEKFAKLAGLEPVVEHIDFQTEFRPLDYDLIFCPPGEISSFEAIVKKLEPVKDQLMEFIDKGKVLLATGTSMAIWGNTIKRTDTTEFAGLGIVDFETVEREKVYGDDTYFTINYNGKEMEMFCSQIQMADFISGQCENFGKLIYGYGNTGKDQNEGFILKNSIFTNSLGPILVTNPWLSIEIIRVLKGKEIQYDDNIEKKSFETKKKFTLNKVTRLSNCKR